MGPLCLLLMLPALSSAGCEGQQAPWLARIDTVDPGVLEPGDVLVVEGEGFVEGTAELVFDGELITSGAQLATRSRTIVEALAVSSTRIELPITGTVLFRLSPEPAVFSGTLQVAFPTALAGSSVRVEARHPDVSLELRPAGGAVAAVAQRAREAEAVLATLGIELAGDAKTGGLLVERVLPGSPADRAGLDPQDRLLALNGKALAGAADISGLDLRASHALSVMSAAALPRELELHPDSPDAWPQDEFVALMMAAAALGLFLAFAAPARRRQCVLAAEPRGENLLFRVLGIAALTVPMLALPSLLVGKIPGIAVTLGVLGLTASGAVGAALFGGGGLISRAGTVVSGLLPPLAALTMAGAFGASIDLVEVVAGQGSTPWGWHGWANPFALAATLAATALIWPERDLDASPLVARILSWITACGGSILLTACILGGWLAPGAATGEAGAPLALIAGALIFAAKCWLVLAAARWLAGAGRAERRGRRGRRAPARLIAALGLMAALGLALAWDRAGLPAQLDIAGRVLASGVFATLSTALLGRRLAGLLARHGVEPGAAKAVSDPAAPTSAP